MKNINLKSAKNGLSRDEMRSLKGGRKLPQNPISGDGGCGCVSAACAASHGGNGDSYCNGTFCCG